MAITYEQLAAARKSEMVGGDLIVFMPDGKRVIAGRNLGPSFAWTDEGVALAVEVEQELIAAAAAAAAAAEANKKK